MDLVPKPDQVLAAVGNVAHRVLYGSVADLRPMPRTLIDKGELRELYHYRLATATSEQGDPVLLVAPLAAPAICYDLRRGCSVVEHFVQAGRPTYLVEYGEVSFRDRSLSMDRWVDEVLPTALREVSRHAGGRPVHVVGWSLGGIFAMLTSADRPDLPIASLSVLGSPVDTSLVPLVAPVRPLFSLTEGRVLTPLSQLVGGVPEPLVNWARQLTSFQRLVTKPLAVATRLDDTEFLAQIEAVERFTEDTVAYAGRSYGQLYHRFVRGNTLSSGRFDLGERTVELSELTAPVLVFAGATDGIAPVAAVKAVVPLLTGAPEVRFEIVPGGHLGLLTGRAARDTTWPVLDEWIEQWSSTSLTPIDHLAAVKQTDTKMTVPKKAAGKKTPAQKTPAKKTPAKKTSGKKTAAKKTAAKTPPTAKKAGTNGPPEERGGDAIGTNPQRRYGSAGSRRLSP